MRALFIGGTGTISYEATCLAAARGWELTLLNRGKTPIDLPEGVRTVTADIEDEAGVRALLSGQRFDVVADFIVYRPEQLARDIRLFSGKTDQYLFISSASAYQKPPLGTVITESTPLENPFWPYAQDKIRCEEMLAQAQRDSGFPYTVIRPSHTYDRRGLPTPLHGKRGSWSVLSRILRGLPVIVPGDGSSLWTLTHSRDFAKGFVGLMGHPKAIGQAFHIVSDEQYTWRGVVQQLGAALGEEATVYPIASQFIAACAPEYTGPLLGDKSHSVVFDASKVKGLVPDFVCTTPFHVGSREAVAYLASHPERKIEEPDFDDLCRRLIEAHEAGKAAFARGPAAD